MLSINGLTVAVAGKVVLRNFHGEIGQKEIVGLTGSNGSGKSSLANALLGNSLYSAIGGTVMMGGKELLTMSPDERARAGLFVSWQTPVSIPGVSVFTLCKNAYESVGNKLVSVVEFRRKLEKIALRVGLTKEHIVRDINDGFSGGERKRLELMQLLLLKPKIAVLDEIDSGLDEEGRKMVTKVVQKMKKEGTAFLIISHYKSLLKQVKADRIWELSNGRLQAGS